MRVTGFGKALRPSPSFEASPCRARAPRASRRPLPEGEGLELQLQRELDLPRGRGSPLNDPARRAVLGALENNLIGGPQIRVIQNIEGLGTELQIQSLTDSHPL